MANLLRLLIILVFFAVGVIIGNIYLPQKNFDQQNIIVPQKPKASFNVDNVPQAETILKEADKYKNILIELGQDQEEIIGFENNFKRTILQLYYQEAVASYSLELLKFQIQTDNATQYIKAREEYNKIVDLIETLYPLETKEVLVIKEENQPLISSTSTVQNTENTAISTETAKTISSTTTQVN